MIEAVYFDGRSARRNPVRLELEGATLKVIGVDFERHEHLAFLQLSPRLGRTPRLLRFRDGAHCEVSDHGGFEAMLHEASMRGGWLHRAETSWRMIALSAVAICCCGVALVRWGIPAGSQLVAQAMPYSLTQALSDQTMKLLDAHVLQPTQLDPTYSADLNGMLEALRAPDGSQAVYRVEFRSSPTLGPNAFALPDGTVVLLDELVKLADNDEQIAAVVGHEVGHVHYRHGLRLLAQNSAIGVLAAWWLGDASTLLAAAPTVLVRASYSRAFESEADRYSVELMRVNGIAPTRLAELLRKLATVQGDQGGVGINGWLASHPALRDRAEALEDERSSAPAP